LATVFCSAVGAQTINLMVLDQAGAQTVLQAASEVAQQRNAPSAIAVVDPAGSACFPAMDGVRPASADLAIEKATNGCAAATADGGDRGQYNQGRTASSPPASQRCAAACRYASTAKSWRSRRCRLEQGDRLRDRQHRGGGLSPSSKNISA